MYHLTHPYSYPELTYSSKKKGFIYGIAYCRPMHRSILPRHRLDTRKEVHFN